MGRGGGTVVEAIKIGGLDYEIEEVQNLCTEDGVKRLNGHIIYDSCKIRIDQGLSQQVKNVYMWHEIIHGILTHAGIDNHDEAHIGALSYGIVQVLKDNPFLVGSM